MDPIAETSRLKKSRKSAAERRAPSNKKEEKAKKAAHRQLRAIDEVAASDQQVPNQQSDLSDETHTLPGFRDVLTEEHIVHLFDGDLGEFATLASGIRSSSSNNNNNSNNNAGGPQSHCQRVQYVVENEVSGDFFRIRNQRRPQLSDADDNDNGHARARSKAFTRPLLSKPDGEDASVWHEATEFAGASLRDLETAVVVMCQGILTGLCWMDAFNLSSSDAFTCAYSAVADRSRQLFFALFKYPLRL
ncbi:hypothetical protein PybrP1_011369 [[Pythium] brassicae (nom. inval.)]|nr:hypothetical protein PybrP1_011369 [[Pythium] brassicae (nom. inval.)]